MSRIGKLPIAIPKGVQVSIDDRDVTVKGPRGELSYNLPRPISAKLENGHLKVERRNESKQVRALHGLSRSLIANMVEGVVSGFDKTLEIIGVGYRAELKDRNLTLTLGFSHPVIFQAPPDVDLEVTGGTQITVRGIDKQLVGQVAAVIRSFKKPEPYKGKGIRYIDEQVRRKAGKTGA